MTRDDIHKLIAGYATGTLTEEERQALFAAALDDQELFDALAQEQELKELLDEPGVRQRLILSLESTTRKRAWWQKPHWSWAAAATVVAVVLGVYLAQPPEPKRLAVVLPQPPPISVAPVPFVPPPPDAQPAPPLPPPAAVAPARESVAPPLPAPEIALQKADAPREEAARPAAPAPAPIPPQALIGRGGGGGATGGFAPNQFAANVIAVFGFDYSVTPEGRVRIVASSNGFLSVSAAGQVQISNRALAAGSATEILIPSGATSATVVFSAQRVADSILNIVKNKLDAPAGTVSDPNPSSASRLELVIPIEPRP